MANTGWKPKFFETTRGHIVQLLCDGAQTVSDLAGQLALSENAVRSHLASLGREGLVHLSGKQPGTRPGTYYYYCRHHTDDKMQGTIVVGSRSGYGGTAREGAGTDAGRGGGYGSGAPANGGGARTNGAGGGRSGY